MAMEPGARLVDASGNVRLGVFHEPILEVNHRDFDLRTPLGRRAGRLRRHFGYKRFQFLGALSEELVFGCALADLRLAGTAFVHLLDPATGRSEHRSFRRPLGRGFRLDDLPETGRARFRSGRRRIEMDATERPAQRALRVSFPGGIAIDARFHEDALEPMRLCTRAGAAGWAYARKTAGFPVSGTVAWAGRRYDLRRIGACGHADWSAGYMRRHTFWNWGCLAGTLADGRRAGLNVSCGVNETSFSENCFWVDGRLHPLDGVHFAYDRDDLEKPWRLSSRDGRLALEFHPQGRHDERLQAWIAASAFHQLVGRYHGRLETEAGERVEIDGLLGYAESHYAKW